MSHSASERPESSPAQPSTYERHERALLGGAPTLTVDDVAVAARTTPAFVRMFWRAMGFANVRDDEVAFTATDADAVRDAAALMASGRIDERTFVTVLRAQSHSADRLALWQVEALVDDGVRRLGLDDTSARLLVLDRIGIATDLLERGMVYAWRRHLAALLRRMDAAVGRSGAQAQGGDELPLERAIGFVDVVSYTSRTAHLGAHDLAELVQSFELLARDAITTAGARVVKTLGDGVLFVADDLVTGAEVALDVVRVLEVAEQPVPVRGAITWGRVLSRSGDVFGPTVNLASRLADIAGPGQILTDAVTWAVLADLDAGSGLFAHRDLDAQQVAGIGVVEPVLLERQPDGDVGPRTRDAGEGSR
ncbi:adenylate/guanylate cyclase [Beutenbergia cavernae DSM 12333]|uniref:Adenylate/guanylate cyclase n=1 Tax=Beutenbergia cavernae (strain ATCC BAA-8 / DSM 12333 / CCUG 43141 / JCM 11478 / NBRC 16432 / NCIMB 13614 / HKI 0122) TaxID=471853 RepID=C5C110_BEUC1|nr:adenylate/guanylate cyclase domain-containing protein [Beutenbergia cavernae]ACQ79414.1 adenylate/guanylate cyclase [Beutenbergia cavernae DSM 12333]